MGNDILTDDGICDGILVHRTGGDGILVHRTGDDGILVHRTGDGGILVHRTGEDGILVQRDANVIDMDRLLKRIEMHEGRRNKVYNDIKGIPTVGVGHNLKTGSRKNVEAVGADVDSLINGTQTLTDDQIDKLLQLDVNDAIRSAGGLIDNYDTLPGLAKEILVEMIFAMGAGNVAKFENMRTALKSADFDKAADEILDSAWARDKPTAPRAKELADLMRTLARLAELKKAMLHENSHVKQVKDRLLPCILIPLFVLALAGCRCANSSSGRSVEADSVLAGSDFRYLGEPIHPGCVWLMLTFIFDPLPCVAAVDVAGCQKSNRFSVRRTQDGWVAWKDESNRLHDGWVEWEDESEFGTGFFEYKHLGVLRNGIHVLDTAWNGGGSGVFEDLLFVRVKESRVFEQEGIRNQVLLVCVGQYGLGDRFEGKVRLEGDKVIICESQHRDKDEILDLAEF